MFPLQYSQVLIALLTLTIPPIYATALPTSNSPLSNVPQADATRGENFYRTAHTLPPGYEFNSREGWSSFNVTPAHSPSRKDEHRPSTSTKRSKSKSSIDLGSVSHLLDAVWNGLKGIGSSENVIITWYTGHDLQNPSCWPKTSWAPSDDSFACALTLDGWTSRPKCFKFLEVCNGPKKCVFVRVVDTCAGCATGSKHVDLTKAAFSQLADVDKGVLTVQMREATDPKTWYEDLWGPKA